VKDFRPSQYFGAVKVDQLEDGIEDSRIDGKNCKLNHYRVVLGLFRNQT
jgi:hypothetical protein